VSEDKRLRIPGAFVIGRSSSSLNQEFLIPSQKFVTLNREFVILNHESASHPEQGVRHSEQSEESLYFARAAHSLHQKQRTIKPFTMKILRRKPLFYLDF